MEHHACPYEADRSSLATAFVLATMWMSLWVGWHCNSCQPAHTLWNNFINMYNYPTGVFWSWDTVEADCPETSTYCPNGAEPRPCEQRAQDGTDMGRLCNNCNNCNKGSPRRLVVTATEALNSRFSDWSAWSEPLGCTGLCTRTCGWWLGCNFRLSRMAW